MSKLPYVLAALVAAIGSVGLFAACGSDGEEIIATDDGGSEGATGDDGGGADAFIDAILDGQRNDAPECKPADIACANSTECCTTNCVSNKCSATPPVGTCKPPAAACANSTECCTSSCIGGTCSSKQCVADNQPCGNNQECCGGTCAPNGTGGGVCKPLSTNCKTQGNPCGGNGECCSQNCNGGVCSVVSFCKQKDDVCANGSDCCGGNCITTVGGGTLGKCGDPVSAPGVPGCTPKGVVCGTGTTPAACGSPCCSRVCAPTGAAPGFLVCQAPSGCQPTGEVCRNNSDCCGWSGAPEPVKGPVECSKAAATQEFGRCDNGGACREPGSICKPSNDSCSAENNCCEPLQTPGGQQFPSSYCNNNPDNCCRKDALGIPRCLLQGSAINCTTTPIPPGTTCATSADCCGKPCVNNKCEGACIPTTGACTTTADCCTGLPCVIPIGASKGTCGAATPTPDGGTPPSCALYGQDCSVSTTCCDNVPCTLGKCRYP